MEFIQLTEIGAELADIASSLEQYMGSYREFQNKIKQCLDIPLNATDLAFIEAWKARKPEPVDRVGTSWEDGISFVREGTEENIIDTLMNRYALNLHRYELNDTVKLIMNSLLIEATTFRLSLILEYAGNYDVSQWIDIYEGIAERQLDDIDQTRFPFPQIIYYETKRVLKSRLLLLKPPR
ncbi:MAG TPA: hypothetical protein VH500_14120 [Nitrososphaeraceae archaeon]|jgi:hypothetical protein